MKENKQPEVNMNDQLTSKVFCSRFRKIIFIGAILCVAVLLGTACTGINLPTLGAIPTVMATPLPAATLAPTATPDPFEDFTGKDCTNWQEPCPAKFSDWKSGLLLAYAKSIATPFSEEVMNTEFKMKNDQLGGPTFWRKYTFPSGLIMDGCTMTPELNPFKFVAHFNIPDAPGEPFALSHPGIFFDVAQYKNRDGSSGYLTYFSIKNERDILFNQMGYVMPRNVKPPASWAKNYSNRKEGENILWDAVYFQVDENEVLINKWVTTGIIPKELEGRILRPWLFTEGCYGKYVAPNK